MGYKNVFRSLSELFPQIDARILKAVAIEHPKDVNEAAAVVITEIVPKFYPNLADNSTQPGNKTSPEIKEKLDKQKGVLIDSESGASSSSGTIPLAVDSGSETRSSSAELPSDMNQFTNPMPNDDRGFDENGEYTIHIKPPPKEHEKYGYFDDLVIQNGFSGSNGSGMVSSVAPVFVQAETQSTSNGRQGLEFPVAVNQAGSGTSEVLEDVVFKVADLGENSTVTPKPSFFRFGLGSSDDVEEAGENSDAELSGSKLVDETSKESLTDENGDTDAFSSTINRSLQACNIDHLEQIIEDAKSNKGTLFTVMESIMNLVREVELHEKEAEMAKEDAAKGGLDTLNKVEELRKMLEHAKEANSMDAGEVYGERSILTTEVNELENRLLSISEERDKSLSALDEMRVTLETRLAAALEMKMVAEQEKQDKEGPARKAFAEQEAVMEKVVQESKLLQQEAEENSKLREFLIDRGQIVDSLQGEISVICQDIKLLKEKFDERVPLSQLISSSQTSCKLASSCGSSMKSLLLEKSFEASSYEATPEAVVTNMRKSSSPKALVNEGKERLEDGWDIFDKETEQLL